MGDCTVGVPSTYEPRGSHTTRTDWLNPGGVSPRPPKPSLVGRLHDGSASLQPTSPGDPTWPAYTVESHCLRAGRPKYFCNRFARAKICFYSTRVSIIFAFLVRFSQCLPVYCLFWSDFFLIDPHFGQKYWFLDPRRPKTIDKKRSQFVILRYTNNKTI